MTHTDTPVVFVHTGQSQVIVTACVVQARSAGCKRIIVISDCIGPWRLIPGVEHFSIANAEDYGLREFRTLFVNYSSYPDDYARVIMERHFALRALFAKRSLKRILHLDSDLLLFAPVQKLEALYDCDFSGSDSAADNHESVSPHFMFLTPQACERVCMDILATYGSPEGRGRLARLWEHKKAINPEWGVSDMDFIAFLRDSGDFKYARVNQGNPRVDISIQSAEGFIMEKGLKRIAFENGKPYGVLEATHERVFFHALHLQGYLKHLIIHYAQLNRLCKKLFYVLWSLEGRGWLKWPLAMFPN